MDSSVVVILVATIPGQSVSIESDPIGTLVLLDPIGSFESDPIGSLLVLLVFYWFIGFAIGFHRK
jgi:hypothetical protein